MCAMVVQTRLPLVVDTGGPRHMCIGIGVCCKQRRHLRRVPCREKAAISCFTRGDGGTGSSCGVEAVEVAGTAAGAATTGSGPGSCAGAASAGGAGGAAEADPRCTVTVWSGSAMGASTMGAVSKVPSFAIRENRRARSWCFDSCEATAGQEAAGIATAVRVERATAGAAGEAKSHVLDCPPFSERVIVKVTSGADLMIFTALAWLWLPLPLICKILSPTITPATVAAPPDGRRKRVQKECTCVHVERGVWREGGRGGGVSTTQVWTKCRH